MVCFIFRFPITNIVYYENGKINNGDYALFVLRVKVYFEYTGCGDGRFLSDKPKVGDSEEMDKDILGGELRVLRSASDWLKQHCDGLIHLQNMS